MPNSNQSKPKTVWPSTRLQIIILSTNQSWHIYYYNIYILINNKYRPWKLFRVQIFHGLPLIGLHSYKAKSFLSSREICIKREKNLTLLRSIFRIKSVCWSILINTVKWFSSDITVNKKKKKNSVYQWWFW